MAKAPRIKFTWLGLALLSWVSACGGLVTNKPTAGGESHFLKPCTDGCGGLQCISDVCTRSCTSDASCDDLAPSAVCTNTGAKESSTGVCDVGCASATDCGWLGPSFACVEDFCRASPTPDPTDNTEPGSETAASTNVGAASTDVSASASQTATEFPALCSLPFDPGACNVLERVYTAVDGACVPAAYGGCGGNDNRFSTFEECVATCEGTPRKDCSVAYDAARVCVACAPTGGCLRYETICSRECKNETQCTEPGFACIDHRCQPPPCP